MIETAPPRIALALGGGGARGLAHLGALEVLHDNAIPIASLYGVSVGSIVAAQYAFEPNPHKIREDTLRYLASPQFRKYSAGVRGSSAESSEPQKDGFVAKFFDYLRANRTFHRMILGSSLLPGSILEEVVNALVPDADIADARIPLRILAIDLFTGREVEISRGPVRRAVLGSASLPGIFPPVEYGGCLLCDVGVIAAVPCHAARKGGADRVLAIDVTMHPVKDRVYPSAIDVMLRVQDIASALFLNLVLQQADVVIRPDVAHLQWTDFRSIPDTIERGRVAAVAALPRIRACLGSPETKAVG